MSPFFFINARLSHKLMSTDEYEALINKMPDIIKRYRTVEASDKYKEFRALEMTVSTDFFRSQKDKILGQKNGKKLWAESEEGKQEARLAELKKDDDILFLQRIDEKQIRQVEALRPVVKDNFDWKQLSDSPWSPGFLYPSKDFVAVHSYVNELQAYTGGKNVRIEDGILHIDTRKEPTTAPAWDEKKGMVQHLFPYSSDVIHTDAPINRNGGMAMIKARCRGYVNHGAYLRGKKHLPMLFLFNYTGFRLYCGLKTESQQENDGMIYLRGLQPIPYIIYTVAWDKSKITWFVNNLPVHTAPNTLPQGEDLYLHIYSCLFSKQRHTTEGHLDVDWIRCYNYDKE